MTRALPAMKVEADPARDRHQLHGSSFAAMRLGGHALRCATIEVDREHTDSCLARTAWRLIRLMQRRDDRNYLLSFMSPAQV
jgi:hypothetical protein